MSRDSVHKKLGRVRPPRVHITYEVHTGGAMEKREIPFVVGVLADLAGQSDKPVKKLKDRNFVQIDRDNFDLVMEKIEPRVTVAVDNTRHKGTQISGDFRFRKMADFEPANVAKQVPELKELLDLRNKLSSLRSSVFGNDQAEALLQEVVTRMEKQKELSGDGSKEIK